MISAASWIRKGAACTNPTKFQMTEDQYQDIMSRARFEIEDAKESLCQLQNIKDRPPSDTVSENAKMDEDGEDDLAKFNLNNYDDDDEGEGDKGHDVEEESGGILEALSNIDAMALGEEEDEYMKDIAGDASEEDENDKEDLQLRESDNLLLACRTEDEISHLEVYVYEEGEDNLYVHHDIMLPAFPLCVEWIGAPINGLQGASSGDAVVGNFAAVGTFEPEIEIWNLDVLEVPYPTVVLGQKSMDKSATVVSSMRKGKKTASSQISAERHTEAVMSLSWNKLHSSLLLSGSADTSVKLWDMTQAKCLRSFEHHKDKVQTLQWNPRDASLLGSAAYDRTLQVFDCRTPGQRLSWRLLADPECLKWNPQEPETIYISDEEGRVQCFDTRLGGDSAPLFTLQAHSKAVTTIDFNPALPSCILTASADRTVKLWNMYQGQPQCLAERELGVGKIFSAAFSPDSPNLLQVAGSKGVLSVLNLYNDQSIVEAFQSTQR